MRFEPISVRRGLAGLGPSHRICFAAFWAQRIWPLYARYAESASRGDPDAVQSCLDVAWAAAAGASIEPQVVRECQDELVELAPNIEEPPILAYAAMECTAATWDALAVVENGSLEHAVAACMAYEQVVAHVLISRDHPGVRLASKEADPLGLSGDPIWEPSLALLDALVSELASTPSLTDAFVERWKETATQLEPVLREVDLLVPEATNG